MTIKEFLEEIQRVFEKCGITCAAREAMLLACHVLSKDQLYLIVNKDEYIDEKILLAAAALVNERCSGRPLAYILGSADFYGINITVDERVLIPRPETELMVEEILKSDHSERDGLKILDLCTGSGCIAAALAENLPSSSILASELSLKAYQIANYNLRKYDNVKLCRSDLFENIEESFDIIVSNPPYVALKDKETLQREVKDHEPEVALFAGEDGLDIIRRLIPEVPSHLNDDGLFFMEMGEEQGNAVLEIAKATGAFDSIEIKKDLSSLDRYLVAKKR